MIVVHVNDPTLRKAACRAAHPEEDVITDLRAGLDAIELGYPRLVIKGHDARLPAVRPAAPVLEVDGATLRRWEAERRSNDLPPTRLDFATQRLRALIESTALERTWVDGALADLARAAGTQLPGPLRSFARRILEFPVHYTTLHAVSDVCGLSRGALKARFRRRALDSPYTYQRWFRIMAVANLLSDRKITVAVAARRMGFTSDGNLCRMMATVCGMTPTELRTVHGWNRLLISFAWLHLTPEALEAWSDLELFLARGA